MWQSFLLQLTKALCRSSQLKGFIFSGISEDQQPFLSDPPNMSSDGLDLWSGQGHQGFTPAPPSCMDNNVQLTPTWEDRNASQDQFNFSMSMYNERLEANLGPPRDRSVFNP